VPAAKVASNLRSLFVRFRTSRNPRRGVGPAALVLFILLTPIGGSATVSAQERKGPLPETNANACLVWVDSLLANAYYQVAKNGCDYPIRIEYRYETESGAGCFGASPCIALLQPSEIKRFTAGALHHWACRVPATPRFPDITKDGWCE
jgi:hypothetical protein